MFTFSFLCFAESTLWYLPTGINTEYILVSLTLVFIAYHYQVANQILLALFSIMDENPRKKKGEIRDLEYTRADNIAQNKAITIPAGNCCKEDALVSKVRIIIEKQISNTQFDVEKLCRETGMSNSQLHRKLTAATGYSANRFIRYVRLLRAKELLYNTDLPIAAIADDCGFNDPVYFARAFKQTYGITPSEWRKNGGQ